MEKEIKKKRKIKPNRFFGRILTVRGITEMAIFISLALIFDLEFLKFRIGEAQSFSITMLPLIIIALRFPLVDAFLGIGGVYGVITMFWDGYGPINYPLDYLLGYGFLAIISLFQTLVYRKYKHEIINYLYLALAIVAGVSGRILFSTINGVLVWETTFIGSFIYNGVPISVSGLMCGILSIMLFPTLLRFKPQTFIQTDKEEIIEQ